MSLINKEVEDFAVQAFVNGEFKKITKADIMGKWTVFFFYPADFTFVCPTELEDLQNKMEDFNRIGCQIFSVSTDSHFVHKAWHDHSDRIKKITYPTEWLKEEPLWLIRTERLWLMRLTAAM